MFTLPNLISLTRFPLAFLFLFDSTYVRLLALLLAGLSDVCDGYIARRYNCKSRFGTVLDPIMDKFFVIFALAVFISEGRLLPWETVAMLSRDIALILFGAFLAATGTFKQYAFRAIWSGKASTFLQLSVLAALAAQLPVPGYFYSLFVILGVLAFTELYKTRLSNI